MSKKHRNVCMTLNYTEHFLILASAVTGCISVSAFAFLFGIAMRTASSSVWLKIWGKKHRSIIKKKKDKHDKIVLLTKSKLNSIELLISKAVINSNISHNEFVLIDNVLKEYDDLKEEIDNQNFIS